MRRMESQKEGGRSRKWSDKRPRKEEKAGQHKGGGAKGCQIPTGNQGD